MNLQKQNSFFSAVFSQNRWVSRLFAAWFSYVAYLLVNNRGYHDISFLQEQLSLVDVILWVGILFVIGSLLAFVAGPAIHSDSLILLVASTVCICCWISEFSGYMGGEYVTLSAIAVYALILYWVGGKCQNWLSMIRPGKTAALVVALIGMTVAATVLGTIGVLRYKTFSSPNFDFGIFVNMFHNMKETGEPLCTCERDRLLSHFAVHLSPIFYVLLPFYYLFPSPLTLQIGQAVILMLGVIPVYLLARQYRYSGKTTALLCLLYTFYPALTTGCFYDIHENCFLPFFLLWTFYFFESRKFPLMYLSGLCVLMVKEDAAVFLLIFAAYLFLSRRNRLHGVILAAMAVGYFLLAIRYLNEHGDGLLASDRFYNLMYNEEDGVFGIVKTALINPGYLVTQLFKSDNGTAWNKLWFFLQMLLPVGFVPFVTKKASRWLLISPILINLLTNYPYLHDTGFQYQFGVCAFLVYALLLNLKDLHISVQRPLLTLAAASTLCLYLFSGVSTLSMYQSNREENRETYQRMEEILATVPEDASVSASAFLVPHLAQRNEIYEVGYHQNKTDIDYVVLDLRYDDYRQYYYYYDIRQYETILWEDGLIAVMRYNPEYYPAPDIDD